MSGMSHLEPKFRGMRRNQQTTVKVEEKRLQRLLDFIDSRMQDQRSKLKQQIEDTQHTAEEMEEKRHKATLQLLKNYFEVTSGRVKPGNSHTNSIHEERMMGVLSEPSLATVPEVDPDILSKPRSMYDRITRNFDTSRLPMIPPHNRNIITQSQSVPNSIPNSNRSDDGSMIVSASPRSTPHGTNTPTDSSEESPWTDNKKPPLPLKRDVLYDKLNQHKVKRKNSETSHNSRVSPHGHRNGFSQQGGQYNTINGHEYQKGQLKPTSRMNLFTDDEPPTPRLGDRLGDIVQSKNGLSRHSSLRRPMNSNSSTMSTMSLSELQLTRKQKAASKLKHALKNIRVQR